MQIRIALCDDETSCHETIEKLLKDYKQTASLFSFGLSCFSSGRKLLDYIDENGTFDLYILDIIMPDMNGIRLGSALRERYDDGMIIYLTSSPDFAVESYNTAALHYLLKPVNGSRFSLCMDKALSRLNHLREKTVSIKTPCSTRIVPIHNILYAERVKRSICYYLNDGTTINSVSSCGTFLHAAAPLLAYSSFLAVGSSFVVNLYHVTEVTKSDMLLTGGYLVPVPRRTYETVKSKWADYWLDKGDIHVI